MVEVFDPVTSALEVTSAAAKHFKKHLDKNTGCNAIYVGTKVMGCSGLSYDISCVAEMPNDSTKFELHGLIFYVANKSMDFLNGLRIDYIKHDFNLYKLEYTNPNESARCGCGESFTV